MSEILSEAEVDAMALCGAGWLSEKSLDRLIASHRALQAERDELERRLRDICHAYGPMVIENQDLRGDRDALKAELVEKDQLYHELLYQVGNKYPNESRHETALRYLKRAEQPSNEPAQSSCWGVIC